MNFQFLLVNINAWKNQTLYKFDWIDFSKISALNIQNIRLQHFFCINFCHFLTWRKYYCKITFSSIFNHPYTVHPCIVCSSKHIRVQDWKSYERRDKKLLTFFPPDEKVVCIILTTKRAWMFRRWKASFALYKPHQNV